MFNKILLGIGIILCFIWVFFSMNYLYLNLIFPFVDSSVNITLFISIFSLLGSIASGLIYGIGYTYSQSELIIENSSQTQLKNMSRLTMIKYCLLPHLVLFWKICDLCRLYKLNDYVKPKLDNFVVYLNASPLNNNEDGDNNDNDN